MSASLDDTVLRTGAFATAVRDAGQRLAEVIERTPLQRNARLSALTGADVWLKREDLQLGRSYKIRGAYNTISQLDGAARAAGVVCASAGNHGQGVAYACRALQVRGHVFVPGTTPRQKRERIASLGGDMIELVVVGDSYDEAAAAAEASALASGATLVPAFDALDTVTGQATVAAEILEQLGSSPDVVVLPVGGGGLLAGCATWLRIHSPGTRLVGVEPAGAASMAAALAAGQP
ncbi:MAG: ilvA, partial [Blastococcus sp.]|nr:ilvA [Blastococcus sp.]